jgi:maltose O-acetyltransferase
MSTAEAIQGGGVRFGREVQGRVAGGAGGGHAASMRRSYLFAPWHLLVNTLAGSPWCPNRLRLRIYGLAGIDYRGHLVRPGVFFHSAQAQIGEDTFLNRGVQVVNAAPVRIGARCAIGHEAHITTVTHQPGDRRTRAGTVDLRPVAIEDGCWIGSRAMILPGVTVGEGCVVAAGAVVTQDCEPHGLYGGVPARRLRDLH